MRASTRMRITIALIGLLVLVLIGWFVQGTVAGDVGSRSLSPRGEAAAWSSTVGTVEQHLPEPNFRQTDADAG